MEFTHIITDSYGEECMISAEIGKDKDGYKVIRFLSFQSSGVALADNAPILSPQAREIHLPLYAKGGCHDTVLIETMCLVSGKSEDDLENIMVEAYKEYIPQKRDALDGPKEGEE